MNKICGYSCEHNNGGVCQITNCDKKIIMTTTTEPQILTRWQDPTIEDLKKEINKQKEVIDKIKEIVNEAPCLWYVDEEIERVDGTIDLSYEEYTGWKDILELLEEIE